MPKVITNLEAYEVSLVPQGANMKKFLLYKSKDGKPGSLELFQELLSKIQKGEKCDCGASVEKRASCSVEKGAECPEEKRAMCHGDKMAKSHNKENEGMNMDEKELEKLKKDLESLPAELRPKVEALWKAKEEAQVQLDEIRKQADESKKALEEVQKTLANEREEKSKREFIEKAKDLTGLPMATEKLGLLMKSMSEKLGAEYAEVETMLKGLNEKIMKSGAFTEVGANGGKETTGQAGSAYEKLTKMAEGLVQKSETKMTHEQAFDEVINTEEGRKLYTEFLKEEEGV